MLYTDQAKVEAFLGRVLTAAELIILPTIVAAVERQIDTILDTTFKNTAALYGATRYFDGGVGHIDVDPFQNLTSIEMISPDGSITVTLDATTYVLQPYSGNVTRTITIRYGRIPKGYKDIKIIADFTEFAAEEAGVPSDIQLIATRVVGTIIANPDLASGLKAETIEGHQVVYGDIAGDPFKDPIVVKLMAARQDITVDDTPQLAEDDEQYLDY